MQEQKLKIDPSLTDNAYQPIELTVKKGSIADKLGKLFKSNKPKNKKQSKEEGKIPLPPPPIIQEEMVKKMKEENKVKQEVKEVEEEDLDTQIAELQRKKEEKQKKEIPVETFTYLNYYEATVVGLLTEIRDLLKK